MPASDHVPFAARWYMRTAPPLAPPPVPVAFRPGAPAAAHSPSSATAKPSVSFACGAGDVNVATLVQPSPCAAYRRTRPAFDAPASAPEAPTITASPSVATARPK